MKLMFSIAIVFLSTGIAISQDRKIVEFQARSERIYDTDFRVWHDKTGSFSVFAKFDSFVGAEIVRVTRKDTGEVIDIKISLLASDDIALLDRIRKDLLVNAMPPGQAKRMREFQRGIEDFLEAEESYLNGKASLLSDGKILSAKRDRRLKIAETKYRKRLEKLRLNLHLEVSDVRSTRTSIQILGRNALSGKEDGGMQILSIQLQPDNDAWEDFEKGDVIRFQCVNKANNLTGNIATIAGIVDKLDLQIVNSEKLEESDRSLLLPVQAWYEPIAKRFVDARASVDGKPRIETTGGEYAVELKSLAVANGLSGEEIRKLETYTLGIPSLFQVAEKHGEALRAMQSEARQKSSWDMGSVARRD